MDWAAIDPALADDWPGQADDGLALAERLPLYVVVEKILEPGEPLPNDWAVHGTVGYEFARVTTGLFVDPANQRAFDDLYARITGEGRRRPFSAAAYEAKGLMLRTALASETNVLARALNRISEQNRRTRDFTLSALRNALREVITAFPVYRTYITCDSREVSDRDRRAIDAGGGAGQAAQPGLRSVRFRFPGRRPPAARARSGRRRPERAGAGRALPVRHEVPATDRPGDGQGGGGHRLLPLQPARRAQRGRQRPGRLRHQRRRVPPRERRARAPLAARAADVIDPRHQAQRGRARPHRRPLRAAARVARRGQPLGAAEPPRQDPGRRRLRAGPQRRVSLLSDPARGLALGRGDPRRGVRRPYRGVHAEGGAGIAGPHELGQPRSPPTRTRCSSSCAPRSTPRGRTRSWRTSPRCGRWSPTPARSTPSRSNC